MKIKIGDTEYVSDNGRLIEKKKLDSYNERMKTYFKFGGKIHDVRMKEGKDDMKDEKWNLGQKD